MNPKNIHHQLETKLEAKIITTDSVGGGCIADCSVLTFENGRKAFLKQVSQFDDMFDREAEGLKAIEKTQTIRTPKVLAHAPHSLALEYIEQSQANNEFWKSFGLQLAQMHKIEQEFFGFAHDNYIGLTPQENPKTDNWIEFYRDHRLGYQIDLAYQKGYDLRAPFRKLSERLPDLLSESLEPPCLIHGDLWSGNYLCSAEGQAVLIDPAAYYGHREAELAMTKLFGGFNPLFYQAYQDEYPLKPGWEQRENLYKLYHVLNHLNLFGSAYLGQSQQLIQSYL